MLNKLIKHFTQFCVLCVVVPYTDFKYIDDAMTLIGERKCVQSD